MNESQDILLAKWLSGEISDKELTLLESQYDLVDLKVTLDRQDQYIPDVQSTELMWQGIMEKRTQDLSRKADISQSSNAFKIRNLVLVGIVILCLSLLLYFLLSQNNTETIKTLEQRETEAMFADGSFAVIGPGSKLEYSKDQWMEQREVSLQGQAFFNVNKGATFTVSTAAGTVEVLGTQFDVWSIDDEYMRVTCTEGSVKVEDNKGQSRIIQQLEQVYIVSGNISNVSTIENQDGDWRLKFRNYQTTPVKIVLEDLKRFYQVSFSVDLSEEDDIFTGVLPIDDLAKCIRFIETSLSYESDQQGNNVIFKKAQ